MELYLHFILVNSEYSQVIADDLFNGEETADNIKHLWEDEFKVSEPVEEYKIKNNSIYKLAGYFPDDTQFSFDIDNITIVDCITTKGTRSQFAVSKKLVKKTEKVVDEVNNETHLYFYLKDTLPLENPMDGVYILKSDFPKELISNSKS